MKTSKKKSLVIGEVITLTGAYTGQYVVQLYRYPNSHTLPAMKLLTDRGAPYTSRLTALEDLGAYQRGELVLGRAKRIVDTLPAPAPAPVKPKRIRKPVVSKADQIRAQLAALDLTVFAAPVPLPAIVKMPTLSPKATMSSRARINVEQQRATAKLVREAKKNGLKVTKLGTAKRQSDSLQPRKMHVNMVEGLYC